MIHQNGSGNLQKCFTDDCFVIWNRYTSEAAKVTHAYSGSSKRRVSEGLRVVHTVTHCVWRCAGCWQPGTFVKTSMSCPVIFEFHNICMVVESWSACLNSIANLIYLFTSMFDSTWLNKSTLLSDLFGVLAWSAPILGLLIRMGAASNCQQDSLLHNVYLLFEK